MLPLFSITPLLAIDAAAARAWITPRYCLRYVCMLLMLALLIIRHAIIMLRYALARSH